VASAGVARPTAGHVPRFGLRWYREIGLILAFYGVYTMVRNQFGSASVAPEQAFDNALSVIAIERSLGLFFEHPAQQAFLGVTSFIKALNVFYGTLHFFVTAGSLAWLFLHHPERYRRWRTTLMITTGSALAGFSLFPLMPPRLLGNFGPYGGSSVEYQFVDTLHTIGGLWSFNSEAMQSISNQYAAMPSLHLAWAAWCAGVVVPLARRRWVKATFLAYPVVTLFAIVVTGNHYWLDGAAGVAVLAVGWKLAGYSPALVSRLWAAVPAGPGAASRTDG
jgi:hypothetical protein